MKLIIYLKDLFFQNLYVLTIFLLSAALSASAQSSQSADKYLSTLFDKATLFDTVRIIPEHHHSEPWKKWRTVENFQYGKDRGTLPMIADLEALHPYFRDKVVELINTCAEAGIKIAIVESFRTPAKQAEYFSMGKKYTSTPAGKSRHQYGLAVDVVPIVDSVAVWDNHKLWRKIGLVGEKLGLIWGGRWKVLYDPGHFEWTGGLSRYQLARGLQPRIPVAFSELYPTLDDHLKKLQVFWDAWSQEQRLPSKNTDITTTGELPASAAGGI